MWKKPANFNLTRKIRQLYTTSGTGGDIVQQPMVIAIGHKRALFHNLIRHEHRTS
jgi:hypothetical protein